MKLKLSYLFSTHLKLLFKVATDQKKLKRQKENAKHVINSYLKDGSNNLPKKIESVHITSKGRKRNEKIPKFTFGPPPQFPLTLYTYKPS